MIRLLALLLAAALFCGCELGPFPKDPTTAPSSWPAVDPNTDPVFAAAGGSSCANAIENTKRMGCGFEADDPAKWCATRTAKEVACMSDPNLPSCLALRRCTDPTR